MVFLELTRLSFRTLLLSIDQKAVLDRLPVTAGASFDSHAEEHNPTCFPDTRISLLQQISKWADDPDAKGIFWLSGMAGTGKSTISRTVAQSLAKSGHLGASFFFQRAEKDRSDMSKFFTTVASQLVARVPSIAPYVKDAIDTDPEVFTKAILEQFDKLILQPLLNIRRDAQISDTLIIVVDALDECGRGDDMEVLINTLPLVKTLRLPRLKVFITGRLELPIRLGFHDISGSYKDMALHEMPEPDIRHDIFVFLDFQLKRIRKQFNAAVMPSSQLPETWPTSIILHDLVDMAVPLFILHPQPVDLLAIQLLATLRSRWLRSSNTRDEGKTRNCLQHTSRF